MARKISLLLAFLIVSISLVAASDNWNILKRPLDITLKNFCESWRINVEINNIRNFPVVPAECTEFIGKYMRSTQYKVDSKRAIDECTTFLSTSSLKNDGKDAWIFDVDDTLLSTVPYFKNHNNGGEGLNVTAFEEWMLKAKAPALEHTRGLFNDIKARGVKIFLVSERREYLRAATTDNLMDVEIYGWTSLFLRGPSNDNVSVKQYKISARKQLVDQGYRILGIVGSQWSSIEGLPTGKRTFKLPNSLYYVA